MGIGSPHNRPAHRSAGSTEHVGASAKSLPGLDALRGLAALGVVLLHACVPYMNPKVPGLAWSTMDQPHWIASQCFWLIELFIMPVFLILAGYFAWISLKRSGVKRLIQSRTRRLLVPLGFGAIVILPADLYIWLAGWVADGKIPLRKMKSLKFADGVDQDLWGLSHLWFLEYLFLYMLVLGLAYAIYQRQPFVSRLFHFAAVGNRLFFPSVLFAVAGLTLLFHPEVVWGFQHRFYPVFSKWIYSGAFFAAGVCVATFDQEMRTLARFAVRNAGYALAFTIPAMLLGNWHLSGGDQAFANLTLAITTTAAASFITVSLIGFAARFRQPIHRPWKYLAAASFWIYLVHHPILGLMQIDFKWMLPATSPVLKVLLGWVASVSLSLLTYEVWIRKSRLGMLLGFNDSFTTAKTVTAKNLVLDDEEITIFKLPKRTTVIERDENQTMDGDISDRGSVKRAA